MLATRDKQNFNKFMVLKYRNFTASNSLTCPAEPKPGVKSNYDQFGSPEAANMSA